MGIHKKSKRERALHNSQGKWTSKGIVIIVLRNHTAIAKVFSEIPPSPNRPVPSVQKIISHRENEDNKLRHKGGNEGGTMEKL
jgi:hypothetical protein